MADDGTTVFGEDQVTDQTTDETVDQTVEQEATDEQTQETTPKTNEFLQSLPEQYREDARFADIESIEAMAEKLAEVPQGLAADQFENIPDNAPTNVRDFAEKMGYTQDQLDGTLAYFGKYIETVQQATRDAIHSGRDQLYESWGEDKAVNLNLANKALEAMDPDGDIGEILTQSGFHEHPAVLKAFANFGRKMQEGGFIESSDTVVPPSDKSDAQLWYPDMPSKHQN